MPPRLILLHKQATSARLRFLCLPTGVTAFAPLPALSTLYPEDYSPKIELHPTATIRDAEHRLGLEEGSIEPEAGFHAWVDTSAGNLPIVLGVFTTTDPPFEAAERLGAKFISITDARRLSEIERELLRRAYEHMLG